MRARLSKKIFFSERESLPEIKRTIEKGLIYLKNMANIALTQSQLTAETQLRRAQESLDRQTQQLKQQESLGHFDGILCHCATTKRNGDDARSSSVG